MNPPPTNPDEDRAKREAAAWVLRCDRGLSAGEQDDFMDWLGANPEHRDLFSRRQRDWNRLDQLADWLPQHSTRPNRDLLAPRPNSRWYASRGYLIAGSFTAVAVLVIGLPTWVKRVEPIAAPLATIQQKALSDGSVIDLNRGAEVTVVYTPTERRVQLERGEAYFKVAKNPARPFIVTAAGVSVRAVGTAFDVRMDEAAVAVLVTEGVVHINPPAHRANEPGDISFALQVGQRAVVSLAETPRLPRIVAVPAVEMDRLMAWKPTLLDFSNAPLQTIVNEFNRHNPMHIVLDDPNLASIPITTSFRSDNAEGFIRLLEAGFGVRAERQGDTITLRRSL